MGQGRVYHMAVTFNKPQYFNYLLYLESGLEFSIQKLFLSYNTTKTTL